MITKSALVTLDGDSDAIKIFVGDELKGEYKNRYECATAFANTLLRVGELEEQITKLSEMLRLSMKMTKHRDEDIGQLKAVLRLVSRDSGTLLSTSMVDAIEKAIGGA
jgi:hypothetical protein